MLVAGKFAWVPHVKLPVKYLWYSGKFTCARRQCARLLREVLAASKQINLPVITGKLHVTQVNCARDLFTCELHVKLPAFAGNFARASFTVYSSQFVDLNENSSQGHSVFFDDHKTTIFNLTTVLMQFVMVVCGFWLLRLFGKGIHFNIFFFEKFLMFLCRKHSLKTTDYRLGNNFKIWLSNWPPDYVAIITLVTPHGMIIVCSRCIPCFFWKKMSHCNDNMLSDYYYTKLNGSNIWHTW